jgi:arginyl-tRNA synthetase
MKITIHIQQLIKSALDDLKLDYSEKIHLEHPMDLSHGDYASNVAMVLFKQQDQFKNPRDLAQAIIEKISDENGLVEKVEIAGPGFINFTLSEQFLIAEMASLIKNQAELSDKENKGKKAVVEYSSPNIAKPFTIGHLRSTIIGDSVANLLEETGYEVFRDNHLGDWGTQFGKQIYALKNLGEGSLEKNIERISNSENPVKELVKLYVDFHKLAEEKPEMEDEARAIFKKLEDGDQEARGLWQKCIDWSFVEFDRIYDRLGIKFTENNGRGYGESDFEDKMDVVIEELEQKAKKTGSIKYEGGDNGAMLVSFPEKSKLPPMMILKSDGATLYATRDLATDKWRLEEKYGKETLIVNEVGAEQALYFRQLFVIEEALGWVKSGQRVHIGHGMYRFKEGKMSTRKGNVIWLEDVLDEAVAKATKLAGEERSMSADDLEKISFGALKWADLKRSSHLDVTFDWNEIMTMQGNSGPYLQYTFVRCNSILEKLKSLGIKNDFDILIDILNGSKSRNKYKISEVELELLRNLYIYFEIVNKSATEFAPHHLTTYLFNLAQVFNKFYGLHKVVDSGDGEEAEQLRVALVLATSLIIKKGLGILGIEVVSKM